MRVYLLGSTRCSLLQAITDEALLVLEIIARETVRFHSEGCNDEDPFAGLRGSEQEHDEATISGGSRNLQRGVLFAY